MVNQFTTKLNKAIVFTDKVFSKKLYAIRVIETQCPYFLGIQESGKQKFFATQQEKTGLKDLKSEIQGFEKRTSWY